MSRLSALFNSIQ